MDSKHLFVEEQLDQLDETLLLTDSDDLRAVYVLGCQFLIGLTMDPALSVVVARRMREIRAKYDLG